MCEIDKFIDKDENNNNNKNDNDKMLIPSLSIKPIRSVCTANESLKNRENADKNNKKNDNNETSAESAVTNKKITGKNYTNTQRYAKIKVKKIKKMKQI